MTRNHQQKKCRWCWTHYMGSQCPLRLTEKQWLSAFKFDNGRQWRKKLRELWETDDQSSTVRHLRNVIGPRKPYPEDNSKVKTEMAG